MNKSINNMYGAELKDIGYKMTTVNHFEKKYEKFYFYVDRDFIDVLLLRLMYIDSFMQSKCIESTFVKKYTELSKNEFIYLIIQKENEYRQILKNIENNKL